MYWETPSVPIPPSTQNALTSTERRLRFSLPQTLRKIYLNVANGGFGPGYGVIGVEGGFTDDLEHTVADLYESAPYFYAAGNANAACTEKRLQSIGAAEAQYLEVIGRYGTLEELARAGLIGSDLAAPVKCGYRVELQSEGGASEITAIPEVTCLRGIRSFA